MQTSTSTQSQPKSLSEQFPACVTCGRTGHLIAMSDESGRYYVCVDHFG